MDTVRLNLVRALLASHQSECERLVDDALADLDQESLEALAAGYPIDPLHIKLCRAKDYTFAACLHEIVEHARRMAALDNARRGVIASKANSLSPAAFQGL